MFFLLSGGNINLCEFLTINKFFVEKFSSFTLAFEFKEETSNFSDDASCVCPELYILQEYKQLVKKAD
ncbi:MAG TPA: hypothetical protein DCO90_15660, partial [Sphingobacterium sp.]|nr:hypothetical protein [Sphingobacterium sp.]